MNVLWVYNFTFPPQRAVVLTHLHLLATFRLPATFPITKHDLFGSISYAQREEKKTSIIILAEIHRQLLCGRICDESIRTWFVFLPKMNSGGCLFSFSYKRARAFFRFQLFEAVAISHQLHLLPRTLHQFLCECSRWAVHAIYRSLVSFGCFQYGKYLTTW